MGGTIGLDALRAAATCGLSATLEGLGVAARLVRATLEGEWFGSPLHRALLGRRKPNGLSARPRDFRPADPTQGFVILRGEFNLGRSAIQAGPDGDPWDRPSPTYRLAVALHGYEWVPHLLTDRQQGAITALRLHLQWRRLFGSWNDFSWSAAALERRVFNFACAIGPMAAGASDAEISALALDLSRQARHLLKITEHPERKTERAVAAAVAACALSGSAGDRLCRAAVGRLERLLPRTVLADGTHVSRSPEAGLELLFDLLTLDEGLSQRGLETPSVVRGTIDRLSGALRFFTLGDGRLACFQGGESVAAGRIAAALARDSSAPRSPVVAPQGCYQRLSGRGIMAMVDAGPPALGVYSVQACAQPFALEVVCGRDRLITNCGWSPHGGAPQAFRLADAASTLAIADSSVGEPLSGLLAALMGPRLAGAPRKVSARHHEGEEGVWLDLSHDGWGPRFGLRHTRRLFLDRVQDQLRGEDRLEPLPGGGGKDKSGRPRYLPFTVRFHLYPDARASLARDQKSVLIRGRSNQGWWLRSDAPEVSVEPSAHFENGGGRRSTQVVLRGRARCDTGGRVRWKLAVADT